jgi:hypothetical protein
MDNFILTEIIIPFIVSGIICFVITFFAVIIFMDK